MVASMDLGEAEGHRPNGLAFSTLPVWALVRSDDAYCWHSG